MVKTQPDFRYLFILCRIGSFFSDHDYLFAVLNSLNAIKDGTYIPMSQESKIDLQQRFYNRCVEDKDNIVAYRDIVGDEDVISNSTRN